MLGYSAGGRNPTARAGPMLSYLQARKALSRQIVLCSILWSLFEATGCHSVLQGRVYRQRLFEACAHGESTDSVRPQESDGARRLGTDGIDNVCRVVLE